MALEDAALDNVAWAGLDDDGIAFLNQALGPAVGTGVSQHRRYA